MSARTCLHSQAKDAVIPNGVRSTKSKDPCILLAVARTSTAIALLVAAPVFCLTIPAHAQGCTQCLDSTRAAPPAVQAAYRHAIFLLAGAAAFLFITATVLLRRNR